MNRQDKLHDAILQTEEQFGTELNLFDFVKAVNKTLRKNNRATEKPEVVEYTVLQMLPYYQKDVKGKKITVDLTTKVQGNIEKTDKPNVQINMNIAGSTSNDYNALSEIAIPVSFLTKDNLYIPIKFAGEITTFDTSYYLKYLGVFDTAEAAASQEKSKTYIEYVSNNENIYSYLSPWGPSEMSNTFQVISVPIIDM